MSQATPKRYFVFWEREGDLLRACCDCGWRSATPRPILGEDPYSVLELRDHRDTHGYGERARRRARRQARKQALAGAAR